MGMMAHAPDETMDFPNLLKSGLPMTIDHEAFDVLPHGARVFINDVLDKEFGCLFGWGWSEIVWIFQPTKRRCVKVCMTGSPARDISFVWVYNVDNAQYELYETQYHEPISLYSNDQHPEKTADTFNELLCGLKFMKY